MTEKFPKNEKLKQSKLIEQLFREGKSVYYYPIKLMYFENDPSNSSKIKVGVSVSKRNFKRAIDRNLIKRRMREAYRKNKPNDCSKSFNCMILYTSKKIETYKVVENQIVECLKILNRVC
jgi:ribonuclease P protein component